MFIDRFSQEWKDADQFAKDSRRNHSAFSKEESDRLDRELELERTVKMFRRRNDRPDLYNCWQYFKGSVFDFIRFSRSKSECFFCPYLFNPTTTPEAIYEKYQQAKNTVRKTHYHQYD